MADLLCDMFVVYEDFFTGAVILAFTVVLAALSFVAAADVAGLAGTASTALLVVLFLSYAFIQYCQHGGQDGGTAMRALDDPKTGSSYEIQLRVVGALSNLPSGRLQWNLESWALFTVSRGLPHPPDVAAVQCRAPVDSKRRTLWSLTGTNNVNTFHTKP